MRTGSRGGAGGEPVALGGGAGHRRCSAPRRLRLLDAAEAGEELGAPGVGVRIAVQLRRDGEDLVEIGETGRSAEQLPDGQAPADRHRRARLDQQLRRFMGTRSGRKARYATLLVEALDDDAIPDPLRAVLAWAVAT